MNARPEDVPPVAWTDPDKFLPSLDGRYRICIQDPETQGLIECNGHYRRVMLATGSTQPFWLAEGGDKHSNYQIIGWRKMTQWERFNG